MRRYEPTSADSFVSSVLPGDGLDLHFDLGMRWSAARGFSFEGSASAELDLPLHLSIAGLEINRLHIGVKPTDSQIALEVSVAAGVKIGPVSAALDRVGALASFAFRDGNLGPIDVDLDFAAVGRRPVGGCARRRQRRRIPVSRRCAGPLRRRDAVLRCASRHHASGPSALSPRACPTAAAAYAHSDLHHRRTSARSRCGLGFTLLGIGGMVGVNRTFDEEALRQGLKNGTLATLLFPRDPVGNAPALIRSLSSAFPARQGQLPAGLVGEDRLAGRRRSC